MNTDNILVDPESEAPEPTQAATPEEVKKPSKFEGKSIDDVISAYTHLEQEYGRKANELGQIRKLTDQLLGLEQAKLKREESAKPAKKLTSDELFEDPDGSITAKAREVAEARAAETDQRVAQLEAAVREEVFEKHHPGFRKTIETPEFIDFVRQSPYRQGLVQRAAQDDWNAAHELFLAWEERQQSAPAAAPAEPKKAAKQAGLVKSGGSSAAGVQPRNDGKKVYSRAELIDMRINDPDGFDERFQSEYLPAYLEGRVR